MAALPQEAPPAPANGVPARGPSTPPSQWIVIGPRTRAHMAAVLEQPLSAVWIALLEVSGAPPGAAYKLVIGEAHLEPAPPDPPAPNGR